MTVIQMRRPTAIEVGPGPSELDGKLEQRFAHLDPGQVRAVVNAVQQEFAGARVRAFVDILTEREAVERLSALQIPYPAQSP